MDFSVELSEQAQGEIAAIYEWLRSQQAGDAGEHWFVALRAAIESLGNLPSRCPLASENRRPTPNAITIIAPTATERNAFLFMSTSEK